MKIEVDACDICGNIPGSDCDNIVFYHPCEHAICDICMNRARKKEWKWEGHGKNCPLCNGYL
jgi:hypothetical protein